MDELNPTDISCGVPTSLFTGTNSKFKMCDFIFLKPLKTKPRFFSEAYKAGQDLLTFESLRDGQPFTYHSCNSHVILLCVALFGCKVHTKCSFFIAEAFKTTGLFQCFSVLSYEPYRYVK